MSSTNSTHSNGSAWAKFLTSRAGLLLIAILAIIGVYLWIEHRAHMLAVLLWLPLVACPLMHLFHRHGGHSHRIGSPNRNE
jgi:DUF2933 family protein